MIHTGLLNSVLWLCCLFVSCGGFCSPHPQSFLMWITGCPTCFSLSVPTAFLEIIPCVSFCPLFLSVSLPFPTKEVLTWVYYGQRTYLTPHECLEVWLYLGIDFLGNYSMCTYEHVYLRNACSPHCWEIVDKCQPRQCCSVFWTLTALLSSCLS